ncbi:MAG TPA: lytic transglycosylase domain-containing protein [Stellaceae bacterium]|nr:lytic transglycosylase domain-containing protein [Stellaceae bacterium]
MLRVFRLLFAVALGAAVTVTAAHADETADKASTAAVAAARAGNWSQAYAQAVQSHDPLTQKIVTWLDYTRSNPGGRFAEIAGFVDQNPNWPLQKTLRRRAEEAMAGETDDTAADWFRRHPPLTGVGKVRAAEILLHRGDTADGTEALRAAWIDGDFSITGEHDTAARYASILRPEDHQKRLARLLWEGQGDAARRMLPLVPPDYRTVVEARFALAGDIAKPDPMIARIPAALRDDPGLALDEARWQRRHDNFDAAAQLLLSHSDNPVRPSVWWAERLYVARRLLAAGNTDTAYQLVQQHGAVDENSSGEAEFLGGYIALRYKKDPALAFDHFAHVLAQASSPYAEARGAYWSGRAAAAMGKPDLAAKWYAAGADHMATFYGQLSAHELGKDAPPHPVAEPKPTDDERAHFEALELVRAARLCFAAGDREHAKTLLLAVADKAKTPLDFGMLASLAESYGRVDVAIAVARRAIESGMPLMVHGYPVTSIPGGGTAERPLLLAIVRQESAFATDAMSRVGARGLMQLMPATAAGLATKLQMPFSLDRLTADGIYNVTLGRSYVETLMDDFGGSYALAIAAYNAGPGRVRQWLHDFGDPRGGAISMVDWIEMIPFNETRLYVQRVLENLQVYRGQNGDAATAFSLVSDLAR